MCLCSFVCAYNSAPPLLSPKPPTNTVETPECYSRKRLPECGRMRCFLDGFIISFLFFQTPCVRHITIFASRTEPGQKKNDKKKKSIPLGGEKNVNDKRRLRARTYIYIYTLHYDAHTIILVYTS